VLIINAAPRLPCYCCVFTHADYVGRRRQDFRVRLFVCLFVCCPQHNSETNDPKVFKLGIAYRE